MCVLHWTVENCDGHVPQASTDQRYSAKAQNRIKASIMCECLSAHLENTQECTYCEGTLHLRIPQFKMSTGEIAADEIAYIISVTIDAAGDVT